MNLQLDDTQLNGEKSEVEVVVYQNPAKRKNQECRNIVDQKRPKPSKKSDRKRLYEARHDVRKFAISNQEGSNRDNAMQCYLIEKGAKPPKNEYHNYKELMQKKSAAKLDDRPQLKGKSSRRKQRFLPRFKKQGENDTGLSGAQIGKFRDGVLKLNKQDINKVLNTKFLH